MKFETFNETIIQFYNDYLFLKKFKKYIDDNQIPIRKYIENDGMMVHSRCNTSPYYRLTWKNVHISSQSTTQANKYILEHIYDKCMIKKYIAVMQKFLIYIQNMGTQEDDIDNYSDYYFINNLDYAHWNYKNSGNSVNNEIFQLRTLIKRLHFGAKPIIQYPFKFNE